MKMNATPNPANLEKIGKRKRNGVRPPVRAEELKGRGANPRDFKVKGNPGGRRSSAALTGERGAPNPKPKAEASGEKRPAPSTLGAGGADKSSEKAIKRRLTRHCKCLQAAGVKVKFPEEG